ncbi:hypothetical protein V1477_000026 [Vespula maculifrons]|uniref:Uncharacterized protein n=1 Tax=Vespula maculifrons TaxID=7453 RepID=A0ABD2D2X5_VESMC
MKRSVKKSDLSLNVLFIDDILSIISVTSRCNTLGSEKYICEYNFKICTAVPACRTTLHKGTSRFKLLIKNLASLSINFSTFSICGCVNLIPHLNNVSDTMHFSNNDNSSNSRYFQVICTSFTAFSFLKPKK